ncbi:MAG: DUF1273 family protein [Clostridia bacterium]|nr:DUF1273 family protein [Clostridia bacterium]
MKKACCFTGHRRIASAHLPCIKEKLKKEILTLIEGGVNEFITGGALGFDTLAATIILGIKKEYPDVKLFLYLPCPEQDKLWSDKDKAIYRDILKEAARTEYVCPSYRDGCMLQRNRAMVDASSVCIAYYDGRPRSGTAMTVSYAGKKGVPVINIY